MQRSRLGKTEVHVSKLGLGTVKFGRNRGLRYAPFELPSFKELEELLATASDLGINLLDTAHAYGESEARLGQLLKGQRDRWVISTKAGEIFDGESSSYHFDPLIIEQTFIESLERLQTDYIDVFLLHCDHRDQETVTNEELLKLLESFKKRGLVRAIGASTQTNEGAIKAAERLDCVMVTYNQSSLSAEPIILDAKTRGAGVLIKKPLDCGRLDDPLSSWALPGFKHADCSVVGTINVEHLREHAEHHSAS